MGFESNLSAPTIMAVLESRFAVRINVDERFCATATAFQSRAKEAFAFSVYIAQINARLPLFNLSSHSCVSSP